MSTRLIVLAAGAAVVAAAGFGIDRARTEGAPPAPAAPASPAAGSVPLVEAVMASAQPVLQEHVLSGQVEPYRVATVAAEVAERLVSRPVETGDHVARGELLASLDAEAAEAALDREVAAHDQAVAARRQAETDYARAVVETDADRQKARAQLALAAAGEHKIRSFTRAQELRQAEAALAQAKTEERLAETEAGRYAALLKEGAVARQTLDHAQATLAAATARRQAAEQAVSLAKEGARKEDIAAAAAEVRIARSGVRVADTRYLRLATLRRQIEGLRAQEAQAATAVRQARVHRRKHRVVAPFAGRVLETLAEAGETVGPGAPIARIGQIARVKVTFAVPEAARRSLRRGQSVKVTADAVPGRTFTGRITVLGYQAEERARTFPVEVTVGNPDEALLPNMVARLRLPVGPASTHVLIPVSAVATDGDAPYVYVFRGGRAVRREVVLGAPAADLVEVKRGLAAGEAVAATPQRLTDGAAVQVKG